MNPEDVPIPERLKKFPLYRGKYLIHYTVFVGPDGEPDFKVIDIMKKRESLRKNWCQLCGTNMRPPFVFIGGPKCEQNRIFTDGPMHEECARYAVLVCPYLADPYHHHSKAAPKHSKGQQQVVIETIEEVDAGRPARMGMFYTMSYDTFKHGVDTLIQAGPWIKVDYDAMPSREE